MTDRSAPPSRFRSIPKWVGIGLFVYATIYTLSYAKSFFVPVVLAILLSLVFSPVRRLFDRRGVPSWLTSLTIVLALVCAVMALLGALSMPVTGWIESAPEISRQIREQLSAFSRVFGEVFDAAERLTALTGSGPDVDRVAVEQTNYVADIATIVPGVLTQILFTLVLLFFLLASGDMFYEKIVHVMPTFKDKRRAISAVHDIERKLSRYLLTITLINAALGAVIGIAMWSLGMPSPFVFGVIAFIFNFIPYLGAVGGMIVATAVALVSFEAIGWAFVVCVTYLAATGLEGQFVTPYFVGRNLRLNTVMVFIAVSFWAWLWSVIGMAVAVPLLAALRTICGHVEGLRPLGEFLSERHSETEQSPPSDIPNSVPAE